MCAVVDSGTSDVYNAQISRSVVKLTAVFQKVPEGFIGFVEELPGANSQGATLDEVRSNLNEAVELVLEANRALSEESIQGRRVIREPLIISGE
jgi:predicted RNase H-like HicB family nuclease